jgi:trimethylamine:corrinoid methyltransferase-like protein
VIAACTQRAGERAVTADIGGKAWGTAHVKHAAHLRDVGGVQAQGLVEGLRDLPRVASRAHTVHRVGCGPGGGRQWAMAVCTQRVGASGRLQI